MTEREGCWFTEPAIWLLEHFLTEGKKASGLRTCKAFEFGMGSSTVYLTRHCLSLISVEHNKDWYDKTCKIISDYQYDNFHGYYEPMPYNKIIEMYKDAVFDLIIVDGRNRVKCIASSIPKLKPGGWLILDNSEREYYKPGIDLMADWNRIDCRQNHPDKYGFTYPSWTTTIFIKP